MHRQKRAVSLKCLPPDLFICLLFKTRFKSEKSHHLSSGETIKEFCSGSFWNSWQRNVMSYMDKWQGWRKERVNDELSERQKPIFPAEACLPSGCFLLAPLVCVLRAIFLTAHSCSLPWACLVHQFCNMASFPLETVSPLQARGG